MNVFYILVLLVAGGREFAMTSIPGFSSREACQSAGAAFLLEAKREYGARYYCIANSERNGTR